MTDTPELIRYLKENCQELQLDPNVVEKIKAPADILTATGSLVFESVSERKLEMWFTNSMVLAVWVKPALCFTPSSQEYHLCMTAVHKLELFSYDTSIDIDNCQYAAIMLSTEPNNPDNCAKAATKKLITSLLENKNTRINQQSTFVDKICDKLQQYKVNISALPLVTYVGVTPRSSREFLRETTLFDIDRLRKLKWRITADKWGQNHSQIDLFKDFFNKPGYILHISHIGSWALHYEEFKEVWHTVSIYECATDYICEVVTHVKRQVPGMPGFVKANKYNLVALEKFSKTNEAAQCTISSIIQKLAAQLELIVSP